MAFSSIREHVLESFSRLFSYLSPHQPSPGWITYDLMVGVLQGQEHAVSIKAMESRLVMTVTLAGWFHSKAGRDFQVSA